MSLHGKDVTDLPPNRRDVNTVFQSYALFDHLSIWDNVAFGLRRRRVGKAEMTRRVGEMLELVQLTGRDKDKPSALSGGQRQRVALARALVNRPSVLLLDEPLAALDLKLRKAMQVELKRIQREVGITFVFVTHDQDEALTMSDRIAVMSEGRVHQCGTPEDIYERPATRFVAEFIGTANLMSGTLRRHRHRHCPAACRCTPVPLDGCAIGDEVSIAVRPEKMWLSDLTPDMVQTDGILKATVYGGRHHDVPARNRARRGGFGARAEPPLGAHRGALGRRRARPHRLARQAQPRTADLNQEFLQCLTTSSSLGAGLAGLSAARDLVHGGADVLVLEARNRVGGRVEQVTLDDGRIVQLGGEVIGNAHTAYQQLVAELGLTLIPSYVAEPGELTYVLHEGTFVGDTPTWFSTDRPPQHATGRATSSPRSPPPSTPTTPGRTRTRSRSTTCR